MDSTEIFFDKASSLMSRLEKLFGPPPRDQLDKSVAWRWRKTKNGNYLEAIENFDSIHLKDLLFIERQKEAIERNTSQFLKGYPSNNALLWGPRGTGKSSLIKALLNDYSEQGLRLVEVEKSSLTDLPEIISRLKEGKQRYIIFCDDLTFDEHDPSYRTLKSVLDGSVLNTSNTIIYATSNRRHLIPESHSDNVGSKIINNELHHSETVEEKISLSERFGIWLSFHPYPQGQYIELVNHWINFFEPTTDPHELRKIQSSALKWALQRGSRSGRTAYQFAKDWAGRKKLKELEN